MPFYSFLIAHIHHFQDCVQHSGRGSPHRCSYISSTVWFSTSAIFPRFHSPSLFSKMTSFGHRFHEPPPLRHWYSAFIASSFCCLLAPSAACPLVRAFVKTSGDVARTGFLTYSVVLLSDLVPTSYLVSLSWFREVFGIAEEDTRSGWRWTLWSLRVRRLHRRSTCNIYRLLCVLTITVCMCFLWTHL